MAADNKNESHDREAASRNREETDEENRVQLDEYLVHMLSLDSQEMMEQLAALEDEGPRAPANTGTSATPDVGTIPVAATMAPTGRSRTTLAAHISKETPPPQEKGDTTGCAEPRPRSILSASMLSLALFVIMLVAIAGAIAYAIVFRGGRPLMRHKISASLANDTRRAFE